MPLFQSPLLSYLNIRCDVSNRQLPSPNLTFQGTAHGETPAGNGSALLWYVHMPRPYQAWAGGGFVFLESTGKAHQENLKWGSQQEKEGQAALENISTSRAAAQSSCLSFSADSDFDDHFVLKGRKGRRIVFSRCIRSYSLGPLAFLSARST